MRRYRMTYDHTLYNPAQQRMTILNYETYTITCSGLEVKLENRIHVCRLIGPGSVRVTRYTNVVNSVQIWERNVISKWQLPREW